MRLMSKTFLLSLSLGFCLSGYSFNCWQIPAFVMRQASHVVPYPVKFWLQRGSLWSIHHIHRWESLPQIRLSDIQDLKLWIPAAYGHEGIYRGLYRGRPVVVKKVSREKLLLPHFHQSQLVFSAHAITLNEARWLMILAPLRLSVDLVGVTHSEGRGVPIIVTRYQEGYVFPIKPGDPKPPPGYVKPKAIKKVEVIGRMLNALGVHFAADFQVIVSPDGKVRLIDPQYFQTQLPPPQFMSEFIADPEHNASNIISEMRQYQ